MLFVFKDDFYGPKITSYVIFFFLQYHYAHDQQNVSKIAFEEINIKQNDKSQR